MTALNTGDTVVNTEGTRGEVIAVDDAMACVEFGNGRKGWFDWADDDRLTPIWDTEALQRDFEVLGFAAPWVVVRRKTDGVRGSLQFSQYPRIYYGFQEGRPRPNDSWRSTRSSSPPVRSKSTSSTT
jgi:hypothetical protein